MKFTLAIFTIILLAGLNNAYAIERIALVVGNAKYNFDILKNPVNDALDIARVLKKHKFQVNVLTNATLEQTKEALISHANKLNSPNNVGIIYFAGHGIQIDTENYLIPVDVSIKNISKFKQTALPVSELIKILEKTKNNLNLVILDSCRNNPFNNSQSVTNSRGLAGKVDLVSGLAPLTDSVSAGIVFWYATRPGHVALDGEGRNSPFSKYLLHAIESSPLPARNIISKVALNLRDTNINQQPWQEGIWLQDFYFNENIAVNKYTDARRTNSDVTDKDLLNVLREYIESCKGVSNKCKNIEAAKEFEDRLSEGTMNMSLIADRWESGSFGKEALGTWQCSWQHDNYRYLKGTSTLEYYKLKDGILYGHFDHSSCPGTHKFKVDITKKNVLWDVRYPNNPNCADRTVSTSQFSITPLGQKITKGRYTWYLDGRTGTGKTSCIKVHDFVSSTPKDGDFTQQNLHR